MVGFLNCVLRPEDSEERKKVFQSKRIAKARRKRWVSIYMAFLNDGGPDQLQRRRDVYHSAASSS